MDLESAAENLARFRRKYKVEIVEISCLAGTGLDRLKKVLSKNVATFRRSEKRSPRPAA
jgi:50S ribosomal subunit-associated GTPase HflX